MDLMATAQLLGNFGEFVGTIAVVATLGYLAVQVRRNSQAIAGQAEGNAYVQWAKPPEVLAASPHLASVFVRGRRAAADLAEDELDQFEALLSMALNAVEHAFRQSTGPDTDEFKRAWAAVVSYWIDHVGGRRFWEQQQDMYHPQFCRWVDGTLSKPAQA